MLVREVIGVFVLRIPVVVPICGVSEFQDLMAIVQLFQVLVLVCRGALSPAC